MNDDGRLLALGALGLLAAGAAARGSRGVIRTGRRSSPPWYASLNWMNSDGVHHSKAVSFHEDQAAAIAFLIHEFQPHYPKSDMDRFLRLLERRGHIFEADSLEASVGEVVPGESFGF